MLRKGLFSGVAAGFMVGIGGAVYLACDNKYMGAIFFTVALLSICMMSLALFTGKVGFLAEKLTRDDLLSTLYSLLGNFIGTGICAAMVFLGRSAAAKTAQVLCEAKLEKSYLSVFFSAVLCGVLMYTAVKIYREKNNSLGILFCVPVFILSGFEHSIADMFYFWISGIYRIETIMFLVIVVIGNAFGGCLLPLIKKCAGE